MISTVRVEKGAFKAREITWAKMESKGIASPRMSWGIFKKIGESKYGQYVGHISWAGADRKLAVSVCQANVVASDLVNAKKWDKRDQGE